MSTRTGPSLKVAVAVAIISVVRARGRLVSCVFASRASPSTVDPAYNPPLRAHAPSACVSSPVGLLARTVRDVPAPPRVLPVSARSSRSESLCPGLSRFARSTARLTASRSPLERARLIAATAFFPRRCRHPIARTVSASWRHAKQTKRRCTCSRRTPRTKLDASGDEEDGGRRFRDVEFDEGDVACMTTREPRRLRPTSASVRAGSVAGSAPLRASLAARFASKTFRRFFPTRRDAPLLACSARVALSGAGRTDPCPS